MTIVNSITINKISIFIYQQQIFFILENLLGTFSFVNFPNGLDVQFFKTSLTLNLSLGFLNMKTRSLDFIKNFIKYNKLQFGQLTLRGTGFGLFLYNNFDNTTSQKLEFRLGFAKRISIFVPKGIFVYIFKKTVLFEGFDKVQVSNFASLLYSLKKPNVYTGKGFFFKREKFILKEMTKL
jgi:hypothetical protein